LLITKTTNRGIFGLRMTMPIRIPNTCVIVNLKKSGHTAECMSWKRRTPVTVVDKETLLPGWSIGDSDLYFNELVASECCVYEVIEDC